MLKFINPVSGRPGSNQAQEISDGDVVFRLDAIEFEGLATSHLSLADPKLRRHQAANLGRTWWVCCLRLQVIVGGFVVLERLSLPQAVNKPTTLPADPGPSSNGQSVTRPSPAREPNDHLRHAANELLSLCVDQMPSVAALLGDAMLTCESFATKHQAVGGRQ